LFDMSICPEKVRDITGSELEDNAITPFIIAASCIMAQITSCTAEMTEECVDQIHIYITSHLLVTSTVGQSSATISKESLRGKYSVEYLTPKATGNDIMSTSFGQTANMMSGGCLSQIGKMPLSINFPGCM